MNELISIGVCGSTRSCNQVHHRYARRREAEGDDVEARGKSWKLEDEPSK